MSDTQRTILVLGTNAGQADLIQHMKARGWYVAACARDAGGPGEALCDEFHAVNIIDLDAVAALAQKLNAALVYSISSDIAITAAVSVSERLGLPHFHGSDLIDLFNAKPEMRAFLNAQNLGVVNYIEASDPADVTHWSTFPCMVKPSDAQGQRGVKRLDTAKALLETVAEAIKYSRTHTAIVEDFLDGTEVSCNVLVRDGEIVIDVLSERLAWHGALTGVPRGHLVPCVNVSDELVRAALDLVHATIEALGTPDGCYYFQMKITSNGPRIIEIAPRLDGCHMWRLIKHATGTDFLAATMDALLDENQAPASRPAAPEGELYELMFQQTRPGEVFSPADHPIPSDHLYHEYRYFEGQVVQAINGKMDNVGYYVRKMTAIDIQGHRDNP